MVQNIVELVDDDIIKVTIKDKPILYESTNEEILKTVFEALKLYAQQEQRIKEVTARIKERILKRKLRRYFKAWFHYFTKMQKISKCTKSESKISNEIKIELFVNAIAERQKEIEADHKNKSCDKSSSETKSAPQKSNKTQPNTQKRSVSVGNKIKQIPETPVQNRLEAQRLIIEQQKAKLAEQNKLIEDIKLYEINKETKQMSIETINTAKQLLNQCDQKTRRSLIHLIKEYGCRDKSIIDVPQILSAPEFLNRMEARAEERKKRMKQTNEIRLRRREEQKRMQEISRQQAEEKERQKQIQAIKEATRIRREQEERRLKEIEKNKQLEFLADQFHKKYLFRRYIVKPLTSLTKEKNQRLQWANQHYEGTLLRNVFCAWKIEWIDQQNKKLQLARKIYRHNLLWYAFENWRNFALDMKQKYQVAVDFYDMKLQARCMKAWHVLCVQINIINFENEVKARKHHEKYLKITYFNIWKKYRLLSDDIKYREKRRDEWRNLIKKISVRSSKQILLLNYYNM